MELYTPRDDESTHSKHSSESEDELKEQNKKNKNKKSNVNNNNNNNKNRKTQQQQQQQQQHKKKQSPQQEMQERLLKQLEEWEKHRQSDEMNERQDKLSRTQQDEQMRRDAELQQKQDDMERLEKELARAIERENAKKLRQALEHIDECQLAESFGKVYEEAQLLLRSIERIDRVDSVAAKLNQSKVSEIHSFSKPAEIVQQVMQATLLVLGHDPHKEWPKCQKQIIVQGKNALHKEIGNFDPVNLDVNTANQALAILDNYDSRKAYGVCEAAGVFYDWTAGVSEKRVLSDKKATQKRKKEIEKKKEDARKEEERKKEEARKEEEKKKNKEQQKDAPKHTNKQ